MKRLAIFFALAVLWACGSDPANPAVMADAAVADLPLGTWTRQFEAGRGNVHTVSYTIESDRMHYLLEGSVGMADYVLLREDFDPLLQRFVGRTEDNRFYAVFFNPNDDGMLIYKEEVADLAAGRDLPIPPPDTTANHGWNLFVRQ